MKLKGDLQWGRIVFWDWNFWRSCIAFCAQSEAAYFPRCFNHNYNVNYHNSDDFDNGLNGWWDNNQEGFWKRSFSQYSLWWHFVSLWRASPKRRSIYRIDNSGNGTSDALHCKSLALDNHSIFSRTMFQNSYLLDLILEKRLHQRLKVAPVFFMMSYQH